MGEFDWAEQRGLNAGGVPAPYRIEHLSKRGDQKPIETFRVWPLLVPDVIQNNHVLWTQMPESHRPRRIEISAFVRELGTEYTFEEWWGFKPSMFNLSSIAAGYYLRVPFDMWGVNVSWA